MWKLARPLSLTRGILMLPPRVGGPAGADGLLAIRRGISGLNLLQQPGHRRLQQPQLGRQRHPQLRLRTRLVIRSEVRNPVKFAEISPKTPFPQRTTPASDRTAATPTPVLYRGHAALCALQAFSPSLTSPVPHPDLCENACRRPTLQRLPVGFGPAPRPSPTPMWVIRVLPVLVLLCGRCGSCGTHSEDWRAGRPRGTRARRDRTLS